MRVLASGTKPWVPPPRHHKTRHSGICLSSQLMEVEAKGSLAQGHPLLYKVWSQPGLHRPCHKNKAKTTTTTTTKNTDSSCSEILEIETCKHKLSAGQGFLHLGDLPSIELRSHPSHKLPSHLAWCDRVSLYSSSCPELTL